MRHSLGELFRQLRVPAREGPRRQYTICPECSHTRKHAKRKPCCAVTVDDLGVRTFCNHCGWVDHAFYESDRRSQGTGPVKAQPPKETYRTMQQRQPWRSPR